MKWLFLAVGVVFIALYAGAMLTREPPPADDLVRLRWATDPNPARGEQTAAFGRLHPGLNVTVDPGERAKLLVQCVTGAGPDIIDIYNAEQMDGYVRAGILLDLTPVASKRGFGLENTYPALRGALAIGGRQYRYPCNVTADAIVYNKAIFDDHGVPYPSGDWTWDEFIAVGKTLLEPGKSGKTHIPLASVSKSWLFDDLLVSHGARRFSPDGLTCALASPEAVAAMRLYADLIYKHDLLPSPREASAMSAQGGWGNSGMHWFSGGRAAMIPIGRWYLVIARNYPKIPATLGAARMPHVPGRRSSSVTNTRAAGVNAFSPNRDAALKFLQFLASAEYGTLIAGDGDSLPPNPALARRGQDLANKTVPDPAFHQVFIDAIKDARPLDLSPFIDAAICSRWLTETIGKVENRLVTPEKGMKALAAEIDWKIRQNLERRPDLQKTFERVTGRPYQKDWWRERK